MQHVTTKETTYLYNSTKFYLSDFLICFILLYFISSWKSLALFGLAQECKVPIIVENGLHPYIATRV